jgi:ribonucleoside-diphosphate reductase alpha chain|tara:strand:+ start:3015 stop:5264 length:2250 start_codon:yes stop_codon:yes gene_type:complete
MNQTITIKKRNGDKEPLDIEKLHKVVEYACEGLTGVSASEVELKSHIQFYNNMTTKEIQETLIKAAADLISEESPNYQFVAGRLICYDLRKEVYNNFKPRSLYKQTKRIIKKGFYDPELLKWYTPDEFNRMDQWIDHSRDETLTYAAMEQLRGKYLVQDRAKKIIHETPQVAFMLIAATLFHRYGDDRLTYVKEFYDALSSFQISMPTPVMAGVRTNVRQFSSCVLIETDDSLDSINATSGAIVKYVSKRAGIGIGAGRIRALGSPINGGHATHTGVIPFYKHFQTAVRSCSQGGVRGGAATLYYPIWHYEIEDLLVLKNNKGTEDNRIRHLDYGVQFNKVFYERLLNGEDITLFSPSDVPELYEPFFSDVDKFRELYEIAERKTSIKKKKIPAIELFSAFMQERKDTGRIYLMNVDHANDHSSFIAEEAPIRMSNLCCEIDLPTKPLEDIHDENGEISLCTLGAVNWGNIKEPSDFEKPAELLVRALDELLSYQDYPVLAAEKSTMGRRPLGIGIINFAYWMAKNNMTYTDPNLEMIDEWTEAWSYYLIKASNQIAQEKGPCILNDETKYSKGIMPMNTYKSEVNELVSRKPSMDWNSLADDLREYGIRNSTLMALMPSETSSQISNATNGIEPPRALVSVKQSKDGVLKQVVPGIFHLKNKYELLWNQKSPSGYLKICAILQKYVDQGISVNTSYNPVHFEDEKIPMSTLLQDLLMFYKYGGKQLYYFNTFDGATDETDEDCESCKI